MIAKYKILQDLSYLDKHNIDIFGLDFNILYNKKTENLYKELFNGLIIQRIYKPLKVNNKSNTAIFEFFAKNNNIWQAIFYDPDVALPVQDVLNGKLNAFQKAYA